MAAKRSYSASEVRGAAKRRYPASEVRGGDERSYPVSEVRDGGREEIPHAPSQRPGATGQRSYPTPQSPRPRAAAGRSNRTTEAKGGGREDQPHVQGRSGRAAVRRYPSSKVRSNGCALLEQP